ncbi:ankyrin repeat domain-containing protein [Myxococcus landrumensis]|uniref:Ankyrin repeat domain-containing protein n=1 Tax=Myxococcus landrumensis TaxID=2813577 RepID=A0ABX7N0P7_9BACT|nr:ankyrin repeat domain-containing protein [Myxococcus landrumus]QSQ12287.1 ankyrin repeat domain-containing protein [Myxococcus landrumus]
MKPFLVRVLSSWVLACLVSSGSASARTRREIIQIIKRGSYSPLFAAAVEGDVAKMKEALANTTAINGPDASVGEVDAMSPLMVAAENGHAPIVRMLLKAKADPLLRVPRHSGMWPPYGWSARCFARLAQKSGVEKLLVEAGASGDAECLDDADFLAAVRRKDEKRALKLGLRSTGRIQQRVLQKALMLAIEQQDIAMIRAVDAAGFNPGKGGGFHVNLPVASGADVSMRPDSRISVSALTPARKAMQERDEATVLALVRAGESPPMLMMLVRWGMDSVVLHQLKAGANPNIGERGGNTPLIEAVLARNRVLVDALLAAGADVNLPGEVEVTPLLAALQGDKPVELSLVERLLEAKADVNKAGRYRTPLMEAASRCLPRAVSLLLQKGARWDVPPGGGPGLYEEAVVSQVSCPEKVAVQVLRVLREGGVPFHPPDAPDLDWLRARARASQMLGPELYAAGLRPEKGPPHPPPDAAR